MLNSAILDVGIALAFVFLLTSLLVSALNELIAGLLKQRAKSLWRGVAELVRSDALRDALFDHPLVKSVAPPLSGLASKSMRGPSYIPARMFSLVLLDLLQEPHGALSEVEDTLARMGATLRAGNPEPLATMATTLSTLAGQLPASPAGAALRGELASLAGAMTAAGASLPAISADVDRVRRLLPAKVGQSLEAAASKHSSELAAILRALGEEAAGSIDGLRTAIERWFDQGMDRISGWYKRWTQYWQFVLGLMLAIVLNVDTVAIGDALWTDIPLRNSVVAEAEAFAKNPQAGLWVTDHGTGEGDFDLDVRARPTTTDRVIVRATLPEKAPSDTSITVAMVNDTIRLDGPLVVRAGKTEGEVEGVVVSPLPPRISLEGSYVTGNQQPPVPRIARRTVTLSPDAASRADKTEELLRRTQLPIGWPQGLASPVRPSMLLGWLVTAIAASFGAPFWFDTLNRFVQLRAGGPKVEQAVLGTKKVPGGN